jgi:hypothetical protein
MCIYVYLILVYIKFNNPDKYKYIYMNTIIKYNILIENINITCMDRLYLLYIICIFFT